MFGLQLCVCAELPSVTSAGQNLWIYSPQSSSTHRLWCPRSPGWSFRTSPSGSENLACCSRPRRSARFPGGPHLDQKCEETEQKTWMSLNCKKEKEADHIQSEESIMFMSNSVIIFSFDPLSLKRLLFYNKLSIQGKYALKIRMKVNVENAPVHQ